jgi:P27 family predicted phage terminase small subunit
MGRNNIPKEVKKLKGTFRKPSGNMKQPVFTIIRGVVQAPPYLSQLASWEWDRITKQLIQNDVLQETDLMMLAAYCQEMAVYWECSEELAKGKYVLDEFGESTGRAKTEAIMGDKALKNAIAIGSRFGLSPSDRQKLIMNPPKGGGDPMDEFLK